MIEPDEFLVGSFKSIEVTDSTGERGRIITPALEKISRNSKRGNGIHQGTAVHVVLHVRVGKIDPGLYVKSVQQGIFGRLQADLYKIKKAGFVQDLAAISEESTFPVVWPPRRRQAKGLGVMRAQRFLSQPRILQTFFGFVIASLLPNSDIGLNQVRPTSCYEHTQSGAVRVSYQDYFPGAE